MYIKHFPYSSEKKIDKIGRLNIHNNIIEKLIIKVIAEFIGSNLFLASSYDNSDVVL